MGEKLICNNKKAFHDYFIEERFEAGISLLGWEVKSMRAGKAQIAEAYVYLKNGEAFIFGAHIGALTSASTHVDTDPTRTRKLLLNRRQIDTDPDLTRPTTGQRCRIDVTEMCRRGLETDCAGVGDIMASRIKCF